MDNVMKGFDYNMMVVINSALLGICAILMGAVAWYFRKDNKEMKQSHFDNTKRIEILEKEMIKTNKNIERALTELAHNKQDDSRRMDIMTAMIKILAGKIGIENPL